MRIIAGTVGGRRLEAPRGWSTRPTADRVREAIFSRLLSRSDAPARVYDLYAGSGALGLEALSRGAGQAVFVESDGRAAALIERNADALGFGARAVVICARVHDWMRGARDRAGWIFVDPPYDDVARELPRLLERIAEAPLLDEGGWVSVEHRAPGKADGAHDWSAGTLTLDETRRYGQTAVTFLTSMLTSNRSLE